MMRSLGIPARVAVGFTSGKATRRRVVLRGRPQRTRLAGGLVRRHRLGAVRTDPWPRGTGSGELHGRRSRPRTTSTGPRPMHGRTISQSLTSRGRPSPPTGADDAPADPPRTARRPGRRRSRPHPVEPASSDSDGAWIVCSRCSRPRWRRRSADRATHPARGRRGQRRELAPAVGPLAVDALRARRRADRRLGHADRDRRIVAAAAFPVVSRPMKSLADAFTEATYRRRASAGFEHVGRLRLQHGSATASHWTRQIERAVNDSVGRRRRVQPLLHALEVTARREHGGGSSQRVASSSTPLGRRPLSHAEIGS